MNTISLVTQISQKANLLDAAHFAKKDLRWWAKHMAKAALLGRTSCDNYDHVNGLFGFFWSGMRCSTAYANALQELMPVGVKVEYRSYDGPLGIKISWE